MLLALLLGSSRGKPAPPVAPTRPGVPIHELSVLDACEPDQLRFALVSIVQAIAAGAPIYNAGDHAGCYHQYLGTAVDIGDRLQGCAGVKQALSAGMNRARSLTDVNAQAWAMRDAFDGLLYVYERKEWELGQKREP